MGDPLQGLSTGAKIFVVCIGLALLVVIGFGVYAAFFINVGPTSTVLQILFIVAVFAAFSAFWQFCVMGGIKQITKANETALMRRTNATREATTRIRKRDPSWPHVEDD